MRVFDKMGYESTVYSKGTDMEEVVETLDLDGRTVTDAWALQFCCSFEDIEHYFGKRYKTFYLLWFIPWKMSLLSEFLNWKVRAEMPHTDKALVFYPVIFHFLSGFTLFKQNLSLWTEMGHCGHVDAWLVGPY